MRYLALVLTACFAATVSAQPVVLPHALGRSGGAAASVSGMKYAPEDTPLTWSVDGNLLVAHRESYNAADVYSSTCTGTGFYRLSLASRVSARAILVGQLACEAALSYDGIAADPSEGSVLYPIRVPTNRLDLAKLDLNTSRVDTLSTGCRIYSFHPAFTRDGSKFAIDGLCRDRDQNYGLYVVDVKGGRLRQVGSSDSMSRRAPTWSPDERYLAYERHPAAQVGTRYEVFVGAVSGHGERRLAVGESPSWSPTGDWIAYLTRDTGRARNRIEVIRPGGSSRVVVFQNEVRSTMSRGWEPNPEGEASGPFVWSPDGKELAFVRMFDSGSSVWILNLATHRVRQITTADKGR